MHVEFSKINAIMTTFLKSLSNITAPYTISSLLILEPNSVWIYDDKNSKGCWQKDGKPASHKTAIMDSVLESFLAFNLMLYPINILLYYPLLCNICVLFVRCHMQVCMF
uniref:Putative ovule protein n=1 Tax=Solanum chacoense TaxID=4108 RepID=A0A0V0GZX0_SOLCH